MKSIKSILPFIIVVASHPAFTQVSSKTGRHFETPVISDSASTMLIPYRYDAMLFTSNKVMMWGDYYANFMVYDFKNDSYKKLFAKDTYIQAPPVNYYTHPIDTKPRYPYITEQWIFYLVRNKDYNESGKIDDKDPQMLFVSDRRGEGLRALTPTNESVVGLILYESLGFALLTIRRDKDGDGQFNEDKDHYLIRLNLSDLQLGKPIEFGPGQVR